MERVDAAVVGAGQSGLATSYWLADRGLDHVLLERDQSGDSWRDRWDSFCLVTPNWSLKLPGFPYDGDDPDGFIPRDAIADHVVSYQQFVDAPVQESTDVSGLHRSGDDWVLTTDNGDWMAQSVVVATGGYPFRSIPRLADSLDPDLLQVHSQDYRHPSALPSGGVLVVGSGQSRAQIVDDLMLAGREVWFAMGHTGRAPRRCRGRDVTAWLADMGFFEAPIEDPAMREQSSIIVSGRDGGKDLDPRAFGGDGVHLLGRILGADGMTARFNDDVDEMLDAADGMAAELEGLVDGYIEERGVNAPPADVGAVEGPWFDPYRPRSRDGGNRLGHLGNRIPLRLLVDPGGRVRRQGLSPTGARGDERAGSLLRRTPRDAQRRIGPLLRRRRRR